jgi:membrane peptidoglycan carboxypeptidase
VPKVDLTFAVPRLPCAKLLTSIPPALAPRLQEFVMKGFFEAQVTAKADFADLDALALTGKVGIDGCKVVKAPEIVTALGGQQSIIVNVEVPERPGGAAGQKETLAVTVGPESPDFAPYDQISPALVNSIMTTEDNGFFKHRGWVTSEFKSALRRNLARGGFRLGASSITMQMVKNVLLSQEKTLSRKLQELFLVWHLEQNLPKERILELYFNAIEFGPRIYGIGAASRHYFGKRPADLTPLEAAFFSSILPSPKRRYIQYCHGALYPPWDKYVRRILAKAHERGRVTDDEYVEWAATPLVFDRKEATFTEKQCLDWVKSMTSHPEAEPPPELGDDADQEGDGDDTFAKRKLKRLFANGTRKGAAGAKTR